MSRTSGALAPSLSLVAAAACWGTATVISKRAVDEIDPLTLLPIQLTVSAVVLAIATAIARERPRDVPRLRPIAALGVLNPGLAYALSLAGLARITASTSVLLWTAEPILILGFAYLLLRQRITAALGVLSAAAVLGVVLIVFQGDTSVDALGVALTLGGAAACALYAVLSSRLLLGAATVAVVLVQQLSALGFAVALLAASSVVADPASLAGVSAAGWASAFASGVLYYGVAFCFYLAGLRHLPAGYVGLFINLVPVFGIATGASFLGERLSGRQWAGAVLVLAAVSCAAAVQSRQVAQPAPSAEDGAQRIET